MPHRSPGSSPLSTITRRVGLTEGWGEQLSRSPFRLFSAVLVIAMLAQAFQETLRAVLLPDMTGWSDAWVQVLWLPVLVSLLLWRVVVRPLRAEHGRSLAELHERETRLEAEADRLDFDARLHGALELAEHERDVLAVVERAFPLVEVDSRLDLLLADASDSHLRRAVSTESSDVSSCSVISPGEYPAVRQGHQLDFADSEALDACPRLRARIDGACAATCTPVSVLGRPVGVLHHVRERGTAPSSARQARLGSLAARAGARIGMVRALADRELQATTDPLTGLANRRLLETRFRELVDDDAAMVVAMCDLDHFKRLNDTHGHDAGDRALRVFADVLRASVRPEDVPVRLGGEEFAVLLPGCGMDGAELVMERVRRGLADRLENGTVPVFTTSVGLAASDGDTDLTELLGAADGALYAAKDGGRDRVVRASAVEATSEFAARPVVEVPSVQTG